MRTTILLFIFSATYYYSSAQTPYINLGEVNRNDSSTYLKITKAAYGTCYETRLEKSPYKIHIQLSLRSFPEENIELYYDTAFKMKYELYTYDGNDKGESALEKMVTDFPAHKIDSIFSILVANGIFSLPAIATNKIMEQYSPLELTPEGVKEGFKTGVADGSHYILDWKVDSYYGQLIFDNPDAYLAHHPDIMIFKRQDAIVRAFRSIIPKYKWEVSDSN